MNEYIIEELKAKYREKKIIPFVGAGLSIPFNLKSWLELIEELKEDFLDKRHYPAVDFEIEEQNYQEAIEAIKKYGEIEDQAIQEKISTYYSIRKNDLKEEIDNNYIDLEKDNFKVYLTTNYDRLMEGYLSGVNSYNSLTDYTSNFQKLFDNNKEKYLFHIHGCVSNPDSIVLSSEKYKQVYSDSRFDNYMSSFSSNYSFLFLGFSFNDTFVKDIIKNYKRFFKGTHYMIIDSDSIDPTKRKLLSKEYGIKIIEYDTSNSSHIEEIRKIFLKITEEAPQSYPSIGINELLSEETNYDDNLFYRKLKLAKIDDELLEVSKLFYIASEKFIRKSQSLGLPKEFIESILGEVFIKYKERYYQIFIKEKKSSLDLILEIHNDLDHMNIDRLVNQYNKPTSSENKGFIHVLADDRDKNIWWGEDRL
ncbi:ABC-three component system protein [Lactococcus lactis]|uniref:ABC-three component system protein n=1 Tax=Lactococcus lactis TaxID=1358 RepID=UPI0028BEF864|nr:ABC-three component system protein [Lactococcus lactis]WNN69108.1 SIR2 family protein [Lactococcus lactis]WPK08156.1 ABC-three component system protein [Lactococcus lactis]